MHTEAAWWRVGVQKSRLYLRHQGINNKVIDKVVGNIATDNPKEIKNMCPPIYNQKLNYKLNSHVPAIMH